jgi:hypothetical protein
MMPIPPGLLATHPRPSLYGSLIAVWTNSHDTARAQEPGALRSGVFYCQYQK